MRLYIYTNRKNELGENMARGQIFQGVFEFEKCPIQGEMVSFTKGGELIFVEVNLIIIGQNEVKVIGTDVSKYYQGSF